MTNMTKKNKMLKNIDKVYKWRYPIYVRTYRYSGICGQRQEGKYVKT